MFFVVEQMWAFYLGSRNWDTMRNSDEIRVRFAPSPTGYLHIGGARTALFNYLFARHHKGTFLLRIEDTDTARSRKEMTDQIMSSLKWLNIIWDGDPVMQSENTEQHRQVCFELFEKGVAYPCFCTPEELDQRRKETGSYMYDGKCRNIPLIEQKARMESGEPYVLRFRVEEGETGFTDRVRGDVKINNKEIDDFVILRSDGTPVYQIAVVVDDHEMGISHVIRGDDHLSNTPKQILIYKAMGWDIPEFAHIPMILGPDKKRLSKRHGATSVEEYRDAGILGEALVNYLALLGWSPGDDREKLSIDELVELFSLERVSKNPAVFDEAKLQWLNGKYIRDMDTKELVSNVKPLLEKDGLLGDKSDEFVFRFTELMKERAKNFKDFAESGSYFFIDPESYEDKAVKKYWIKQGVKSRLQKVLISMKNIEDWNERGIEEAIRGLAQQEDVGAGKYIHPVRLALTGRGQSPGLFELMELLGKDIVLKRLDRALNYLDKLDV